MTGPSCTEASLIAYELTGWLQGGRGRPAQARGLGDHPDRTILVLVQVRGVHDSQKPARQGM